MKPRRLVIVSNRVALPDEQRPGGLALAMRAALRETGGIWFGWSGRICDDGEAKPRIKPVDNLLYATLDLGQRDFNEYYKGFANRTLWPLFHYRPSLVDYNRQIYAGYLRVNELFADHLARLLEPDDLVWVHDYHLIPLADALRRRGVGCRIGFFLHIPFPAADLFIALPKHRELFQSLSAYDLLGFQTRRDLHAFHDYVQFEVGAQIAADGTVLLAGGRELRAGVFPISIDTAQVERDALTAVGSLQARRLQESLQGRALVIGVDRLDYSKGLTQRFTAFGQFLKQAARFRGRISFLQIAPPSRSEVPEYREMRRSLERLAGAINGAYAEADWVPIRYVNKSYPQSTLLGFYRLARVGLVTPLRDGMNLVAKEYVACQRPEDPGVLVLSRFAGAAQELDGALKVHPFDTDDMAEAIRRALEMPLEERRQRWQAMMDVLRRQDITAWRSAFLQELAAVPVQPAPAREGAETVPVAEDV
ncbi:MAG TPA: alpha,alpha-trehalose-phosphate synthase (UDP-forming) [Candidatus Competibacteraceae bacterium]|nr:alpha,alpha-trehalose-phosphate synthase (UDP-forming) [Candidatus Competibacteraceae bacterium]